MLKCILFLFSLSELGNLPLDLLHTVLIELFPVAKEEEDLQDDKERRCDEGLVPGVQKGGGSTLEHSVTNKL